jgi:colanic acid/amylovoran biosynthesis glycosyltransferase
MKLAIFVDNFPVASQTFVLNQVTGLIDLEVDVTVLSLNSNEDGWNKYTQLSGYELQIRTLYLNKINEQSLSPLQIILSRLGQTIKGFLQSAKSLRTLKSLRWWRYGYQSKSLLLASIAAQHNQTLSFDVILCHFGFNGVLANKLRDIGVLDGKIVTIFHGYELSAKLALQRYKQDYQSLFKQTSIMLPVNTIWQQKLIELGCQKEKVLVQRMGVDLNLFRFESSHAIGNCLQLFTVARFAEKKGLEYGLRALALLAENIDFHYKLAGYGELADSLELLVKELQLENKVSFLGSLEQHLVIEQMQAADIFLQPSITATNGDMEGVPVAIMEAMAMGAVVVSTMHSGIPELVIHGQHGLLSEERDVKGLKDNICQLYDDPNLYAQIRLNARNRIEKMASVHKLNQQLLLRLEVLSSSGSQNGPSV